MQSFTLLYNGGEHPIGNITQLYQLLKPSECHISTIAALYKTADQPVYPWHRRGQHYRVDMTRRLVSIDGRTLHLTAMNEENDEPSSVQLRTSLIACYEQIPCGDQLSFICAFADSSNNRDRTRHYNLYYFWRETPLIGLSVRFYGNHFKYEYKEAFQAVSSEVYLSAPDVRSALQKVIYRVPLLRCELLLAQIYEQCGLEPIAGDTCDRLALLRDHLLLGPDGAAVQILAADFAAKPRS